MVEVEQGYGSGKGPGEINIYHNRRHATDVTQAVHYFLKVSSDCEVQATPLGMASDTRPRAVGVTRGRARGGVQGLSWAPEEQRAHTVCVAPKPVACFGVCTRR